MCGGFVPGVDSSRMLIQLPIHAMRAPARPTPAPVRKSKAPLGGSSARKSDEQHGRTGRSTLVMTS